MPLRSNSPAPDPLETGDGKDISHLLFGKQGEAHRLGVTEFMWSKSVRRGDYRFVYYPTEFFQNEYPEGFGELYDLTKDPWEMENLYFKEEYQDLIREFKNDLLEWLILTTRAKTILPKVQYRSPQTVTYYKNSTNRDGKFHPDRYRKMLANQTGMGPFIYRNYL